MIDGNKVRKLLKDKKMTVAELARRVGVTRSMMGYICQGLRDTTTTNLERIAATLGVPADELIVKE